MEYRSRRLSDGKAMPRKRLEGRSSEKDVYKRQVFSRRGQTGIYPPASPVQMYRANYSPDDNKLRLYAASRLDPETYKNVHDARCV